MFSIKMNTFHKSVNCPSSEKLLAYQNGDTLAAEGDKITVHLRFCEFCAAEMELYAHYPQSDEQIEKTEIPPPLFELAEALLSNKYKDISLLKRLFNETEDSKTLDF
jgi:hypothetical protein